MTIAKIVWARIENLLSLYLCAHVGFCKRCCPMAEKESFNFKASNWLARADQCASVLRNMLLTRGRTSFHLSTLEATYIKTSKPNLCKQKEFVYGLKITH